MFIKCIIILSLITTVFDRLHDFLFIVAWRDSPTFSCQVQPSSCYQCFWSFQNFHGFQRKSKSICGNNNTVRRRANEAAIQHLFWCEVACSLLSMFTTEVLHLQSCIHPSTHRQKLSPSSSDEYSIADPLTMSHVLVIHYSYSNH